MHIRIAWFMFDTLPSLRSMAALTTPAPRCCRRRACGGEIGEEEARVETAVSLARTGAATNALIATAASLVRWDHATRLAFHERCWREVCGGAAAAAERAPLHAASRVAERFDAFDVLRAKAQAAAMHLNCATAAICFTGAGLSTAAGLGDYRGATGKWTREAWGDAAAYETEYEALRPTFAHEAVAKLVADGRVAYVISQNADGLHRLSGVPDDRLSDVHGSAFTEVCDGCGARYVRDAFGAPASFFCGSLAARDRLSSKVRARGPRGGLPRRRVPRPAPARRAVRRLRRQPLDGPRVRGVRRPPAGHGRKLRRRPRGLRARTRRSNRCPHIVSEKRRVRWCRRWRPRGARTAA